MTTATPDRTAITAVTAGAGMVLAANRLRELGQESVT